MDVQDQMKLAKVIAGVNAIHEAEKAALRAEVEALRPDAERWRAQERAITLAQAKAERQSAFDTLPDDYETGDW